MSVKRKIMLLTVGAVLLTSVAAVLLGHLFGARAVERAWRTRFGDFTDALVLPLGRALAAGDLVLVDAHVVDLSQRSGLYVGSVQVFDSAGRLLATGGDPVRDEAAGLYFSRRLEWNADEVGRLDITFRRTPIENALRELNQLLFGIAVAASILAALASAHLADRLLRPLERLSQAVHAVEQGADAQALPHTDSNDEIGRVTNALVDAYQELHLRAARNRAMVDELRAVTQKLQSELELNAVLRERLEEENKMLQREAKHHTGEIRLIGADGDLAPTVVEATNAAKSRLTVLLSGESGTGKEVVAGLIHQMSDRHDKSFVTVNCAALPENLIESELFGHERGAFTGAHSAKVGKFLLADGGTIFLDEIGELPLAMQPKLLRVLEAREVDRVGADRPTPVDVRVIAATHRDLGHEVERGRFRQDLYFRLKVVQLHLPPLRDRPHDFPRLVEAQVQEIASEIGIAPPVVAPRAMELLRAHNWPGNVRELRHILAATMSQNRAMVIEPDHIARVLPQGDGTGGILAADSMPGEEFDVSLERLERRILERERNAGLNQKEMAARLGLSEARLHRLLKKHRMLKSSRRAES